MQRTFYDGRRRGFLMNASPMKQPMFKTRRARRIFKSFTGLVMLGVLGVGLLLGALWLAHRTDVTLPTPTGPFAVGRSLHDCVDDKTLDTLAPLPGIKRRELLVWIWYPAATGKSGAVVDDYEPASVRARARDAGVRLLCRVYGLLSR